jgi:hypothetical protein
MSSSDVIFDADAPMGAESSLRGYLFVDPSNNMKGLAPVRYADADAHDSTWTFESVLARLNNIANQVIFDDGNFDKSSFEIKGTYQGQFFDLYDYKGDKCIHIGGGPNLDVNALLADLKKLLKAAVPKPFKCRCSYTHECYHYP